MFGESSSDNKRIKIAGAVIAAVALVALGVVALHNTGTNTPVVPLEKAQAIAHAQSLDVPLAAVPDESDVETPAGWVIESDEPVEGSGSEESEEGSDELEQEAVEADEDIDSPFDFEQDKEGQKYVAELDHDVIVSEDSQENADGTNVAADGKYKKCYKGLRACGARKACTKKCLKKCKPYAAKKCNTKKFCRCFCKFYGKIKAARRCVIYKRKQCRTALVYRCRRACKKTCQKVLRCYCCPKKKVTKRCYRICKKYLYTSKCKKCRCRLTRCVRNCKFVCTHRYY